MGEQETELTQEAVVATLRGRLPAIIGGCPLSRRFVTEPSAYKRVQTDTTTRAMRPKWDISVTRKILNTGLTAEPFARSRFIGSGYTHRRGSTLTSLS